VTATGSTCKGLDDAFVINIADAMGAWSNDRFVSTAHRVVTPPDALVAGSRRQSIAFFYNPALTRWSRRSPGRARQRATSRSRFRSCKTGRAAWRTPWQTPCRAACVR
jgi:isopenicillin N synthase-like dioxygenase